MKVKQKRKKKRKKERRFGREMEPEKVLGEFNALIYLKIKKEKNKNMRMH
jgi:hypothetical protein